MMKRVAKPEKEASRSSFKPQHQSRYAPRPFPARQPEQDSSARCCEPLFSYNLLDIPAYPKETVQPKLRLGPVGDSYEQEADRMAGQVMSTISSTEQSSVQRQEDEEDLEEEEVVAAQRQMDGAISSTEQSSVQRQEDEEDLEEEEVVAAQRQTMGAISSSDQGSVQRQEDEEDEEEDELQRKVDGIGSTGDEDVRPDLESSIQRARGSGQPLTDGVRQPMERAFGTNFGGVRLHTDGQADSLNRSIQARAFTTGQDIFLRQGEYRPGSSEGQRLLAHELTHVVQQNSGSIRRGMIQRNGNGWRLEKTGAGYKKLTKVEQEKFDLFQNAIHNEKLHPKDAAERARDSDYKKLNDNQYQIRLSQHNRATFTVDSDQKIVKILSVGGHT